LKSSTHIKKRDVAIGKRNQEKTSKDRSTYIYVISIIFFFVILVVGYMLFRGTSDRTAFDSLKETERNDASDMTVGSTAISRGEFAVSKAKFQMETADNKDILRVIIEKSEGIDNKEITYKYDWSLNGQPVGTGSNNLSGFKRGDNVVVTITPFDGELPGRPRKLIMDIKNTTPKISESKEPKYDGKIFTVQINASDPDGDALSYELLNGPEGMTIDKKNGIVNWPVQGNGSGEYPVSVKITDGHGGEITYQMTAIIPKELPQPAPVKKTP